MYFITAILLVLFGLYILKIYNVNKYYHDKYNNISQVSLRKFPYPYKAALAINNDVDNIETIDEYLEIHKFLNTQESTRMGKGIGLDIGNSFLPFEPPSQAISLFSGNPEVGKALMPLIRESSIDVIHSYGKKADFSRKDAVATLKELRSNNCNLEVWVDHDKSIGNLGDDVTFGVGDHKESSSYHADLTVQYGIKFAWLGRVTMINGQSAPISVKNFTSIYDNNHPLFSVYNILKEFNKHALAIVGNKKYAMHENNELVRIATLDDGQKIYEFIRFDNYWQGVGTGATNNRLAYVISSKTLDRLKEAEGYSVVYTHLGKNADCPQYICSETQNVLRHLAKEYRDGNIFVTSTSKLLKYYVTNKYMKWTFESNGNDVAIKLIEVKDPIFGSIPLTDNNIKGVTFYVPMNSKVHVNVGNVELKEVRRNPPDYTGRESVTISSNH